MRTIISTCFRCFRHRYRPVFAVGVDDVVFAVRAAEFAVADDVRPGVLRRRDDALRRAALRHGPVRRGVPREPAPGRLHHHRRHAHQQDGTRTPQGDRRRRRSKVETKKCHRFPIVRRVPVLPNVVLANVV